mmetsp:Transcript_31277/g.61761  ORF Transcript_31277/g.61761 Transcript_31277/m.61761 type:complete len:247 (-) Transcript_31277:168-908(-)
MEARRRSSVSSTSTAGMRSASAAPHSVSCRGQSVGPASRGTGGSSSAKKVCDKCDGNHDTDLCPYYKKDRENHRDAQKNGYKNLGGESSLPGQTLPATTRVIRQPGDGSCLFHSLAYGLRPFTNDRRHTDGFEIRKAICSFILKNPHLEVAESPISDWVKWDTGGSDVSSYVRRMEGGSWGGGIEMAVFSRMYGVNVHVYQKSRSGSGKIKRISAFDHHSKPEDKHTVRVIYQGGIHYDALEHIEL